MTPPEDRPAAAMSAIDWQEVLVEHEGWLRCVVYSRLGEPQAVGDVLQEVSLAAVKSPNPPRDAAKVAPWLYRLAVRQTLLYRRKQGRRRKLVDAFAERFQPTEEDHRRSDPLDWLLADERRHLVRQAMANCSAKPCTCRWIRTCAAESAVAT